MSLLAANTAELPGENVERLHGGRLRVTILEEYTLGLAVNNSAIVAPGTAIDRVTSGLYTLASNLKLIVPVTFPVSGGRIYRRRVYETLTASFVDEVADRTDYELNGLKRVSRTLIAQAGTATAAFVVGTQTYGTGPELILAKLQIEENDAFVRVVAEYLEPGIVSKAKSGGPSSLPGTVRHTWQVWAMTFAATSMPGVLIADDEANVQGYPVRSFTTLTKGASGSITSGNLASYEDNIEITRPGMIEIGVDGASAGEQTPYLVQTSPTSGIVKATVTVAIVTSATAPAPVAFNLDTLQVAVRAKTRTVRYIGSEAGESVTEHVYAEQIGIDHTVLRGYVISSSTGSGTEYRYTYNSALNDDGGPIVGEAFQSHIYRTITLSGSGTAPPTTGVWRLEVEPVLTAADGTAYFRVTTWTI